MLDALQRSTCVGELSAFDMEKYLKKTDMSDSSDTSLAHTTFDLTSWADDLSRNLHAGHPKELESTHQQAAQQMPTSTLTEEKDRREVTTLNSSSSTVPHSNALSLGNRNESRRSSAPLKPLSSTRRPVGSVHSSRFKSPADKMAAPDNAAKTCGSSACTATVDTFKPGQLNPQSSSNIMSALEAQKGDKICPASPNLPSTSPNHRKVSSPLAQKVRNTGQQLKEEIPNYSTGKKSSSRDMSAPLPCSSVEKHINFSCQNTQPLRDPACGEYALRLKQHTADVWTMGTLIQTTINQYVCVKHWYEPVLKFIVFQTCQKVFQTRV